MKTAHEWMLYILDSMRGQQTAQRLIEDAISRVQQEALEEAAKERERFVCPECGCDAACRALARKDGGDRG